MLGIQVVLKPSLCTQESQSQENSHTVELMGRQPSSAPVTDSTAGETEWEFEELPATTAVITKRDAVHQSDTVRLIALCFLQHFNTVSCLLKQQKSKCFMHHSFLEGGSRTEKLGGLLNIAFWKPQRNPPIFAILSPLAQIYSFALAELWDCDHIYHQIPLFGHIKPTNR